MPYNRGHMATTPTSSQQSRKKAEQVGNVVSLRISDDEKRALEKLTNTTSKSISDIMRESIHLWISKQRRLSL